MSKFNKNDSLDEIDNVLFSYYKSEKFECIPNIITNGIDTAMYHHKVKVFNIFDYIRQIIITILSLLTLTGGVVFAKDIEHFFNNLFNNMNGVSTAINNGYIADTQMDYINSNNVNLKIDNVLMDDYNLCLNLNLDFSNMKEIDLNNISSINFENLIILDENNNVIFSNKDEYLNSYCSKNNINNLNTDYNSNMSYYINSIDTDNKTCTLTYNFSRCNSAFPKSKNLFFSSSGIELINKSSKTSKEITINCEHNIGIDIPEKFYNREALIYNVSSSTDQNFILNEAIVYETGTKISFNLKVDTDIIDENGLSESRNILKSENKISNSFSSQINTFFNPFSNMYLTDSNNNKYEISHTNSEDNVLQANIKNYLNYTCTFDLTKFNTTDTLKLHFTYDSIERVITLQKNI